MGLAHSPKIVTDGLSFMYDTGSGKSYKGEPTTIYGDPFPTDTTLPGGFHWSYEYDHEIVDAPITGHFLSNRKWVKSTRDTTGSRRVLFINNSFTAGSTYTFSCYAYSNDTNLTSLAHVSHNGGYSSTQNTTTYGTSDLGTVKRIHGTWIQQVNGGPIFGMQTNNAALGTTFYMTGFQVEEKTRATQLTGGSRSTTQGLLDLTKNETIDISNASFDSNAQMTFDGTDDIINTGLFSGRNPSTDPFTVEAMVKSDVTSGSKIWVDATSNGSNQRFYSALIDSTSHAIGIQGSAWSDPTPGDTNWHHQVIVMDGSTAKAYNNGELASSKSYTSYTLAGGLNIGGRSGYRWVGQIPIFKIYDRALTQTEVAQNYNAFKDRFSL